MLLLTLSPQKKAKILNLSRDMEFFNVSLNKYQLYKLCKHKWCKIQHLNFNFQWQVMLQWYWQERFQLRDCSHGGKFTDEQLHLLLHMISELQLVHVVLNLGQPYEGMDEKTHKSLQTSGKNDFVSLLWEYFFFKCNPFCCVAWPSPQI